jgi:hypothetical protein
MSGVPQELNASFHPFRGNDHRAVRVEPGGFSFSGLGTLRSVPKTTPMPSLTVTESGGRVHLHLGGFVGGDGMSLQEAADDLMGKLLALVLGVRSGGFSVSREVALDLDAMNYLAELGEFIAAGGDIRTRLFG